MNVFRPSRQLAHFISRKEALLAEELKYIEEDPITPEIQKVLDAAANNTITTQQTKNIPVTHLNKNALHFAVLESNPDKDKILNLFRLNYSPVEKMNFGYSPLSLAAFKGNEEVVRLILGSKPGKGSEKHATSIYRDHLISGSGFCPIVIALIQNHLSIALKVLIHFRGLEYKYLAFRETLVIHFLCSTKCKDTSSESSFNKLQIRIANILTKTGTDLSLANKHSSTYNGAGILNLCVTYDNYRLMKYFLKLGVGKETNKILKDGGFSPLLYAVCPRDMNMFNRSETVDRKRYFYKLLQYHFDINVTYIETIRGNSYYVTTLFVALQTQESTVQLDIIKVLLLRASQIFTQATSYLGHPFSYAIINNLSCVLQIFFEHIENNIIKQKLEEIPLAYVEKKLNYKVLDLFTPKPGLSNKDVLDVLLMFGLSEVYEKRDFSSNVAYAFNQVPKCLLYYEYLIENVEDVNREYIGLPPCIVTYALSGACGLPLFRKALEKGFDLDAKAIIQPCRSASPHRLFRWNFKEFAKAWGFLDLNAVSLVCGAGCYKKIDQHEHLYECREFNNNAHDCNICFCDDCAFLSRNKDGVSCESLILRKNGAEKLYYANWIQLLYKPFGKILHKQGKSNRIQTYADAGLVDEYILRCAIEQDIYF
eukprot:snap_masked-scaffold_6-processed-gene-9.3-mRNA-1 protein AED:1.00 eAED:1.00 QI:0/-1/0/0/-1/1/1/0/650